MEELTPPGSKVFSADVDDYVLCFDRYRAAREYDDCVEEMFADFSYAESTTESSSCMQDSFLVMHPET